MGRNRRALPPISVSVPQKKLGQGEWVREFAAQRGWPFSTCNLIFEGTTDVQHLMTADDRYARNCGLHLLGRDLAAFAVGERDEGGAENLVPRLMTLKSMMKDDPLDINGERFRVLAIVDDDIPGRRALNALVKWVGLREFEDVIVLQHRFPRVTQDPHLLAKMVRDANSNWRGLHCEIEDFVEPSVLEAFAADHPGALVSGPINQNGASHCNWAGHMKVRLAAYAETYATLGDLHRMVELLKFLRLLLRLPPDGV